MNSIVSFSIFISSDTNDTGLRFLDADECKRFYNLMTTPIDASKHFDDHDLLVSLKESVLLGQPVKLANNGLSVLRIALGADLVVNSLEKLFFIDDKGSAVPSFPGLNIETIHAVCEKALMEDRALIKKAFYLAKYWNILTSPDKTMQQTLSPIVKKLRVFDDTLQNVQNPSRSVSTSLDAISGVAQELSKTHTLPPGV